MHVFAVGALITLIAGTALANEPCREASGREPLARPEWQQLVNKVHGCELPKPFDPSASRKAWERFPFSRPARHDPARFAYLITGMEPDRIELSRRGQEVELGRRVVYASVIDQDHRSTFRKGGLILRPKPAQFATIAPSDSATAYCNEADCRKASKEDILGKLKQLEGDLGVYPPGRMMSMTRQQWNEVIVSSMADDRDRLLVDGLFLIEEEDGESAGERAEREAAFRALAAKYKVPLVRIARNNSSKDEPLRVTRDKNGALASVAMETVAGGRRELNFADFAATGKMLFYRKGRAPEGHLQEHRYPFVEGFFGDAEFNREGWEEFGRALREHLKKHPADLQAYRVALRGLHCQDSWRREQKGGVAALDAEALRFLEALAP